MSDQFFHDFGYWLQQLLNAITLASFYTPLAVAYALVQGITNKIFLSFGDFAMYAGFAAIYAALAGQVAGSDTPFVLLGCISAAVASSSALGRFVATQVFAPLINKSSQAFMIASVGISLVMQETMRLESGSRDLWLPVFFDGENIQILAGVFSVHVGYIQLIAILARLSYRNCFNCLYFTRRVGFTRIVIIEEIYMVKLYLALDRARVDRFRAVFHFGNSIQQLEYPLC